MKILKLLVTSVLMSALLISCSGEDTTTAPEPATTEATAPVETPAVDEETTDEEATDEEATDEEVDGEETDGEETDEVDGEIEFLDITEYISAGMTDEEFTAGYTEYMQANVEAGIMEQETVDMMLSIFDIDTIKAQLGL